MRKPTPRNRHDSGLIVAVLLGITGFGLFWTAKTAYPVEVDYAGLDDSIIETLKDEPALKNLVQIDDAASPDFPRKLDLAKDAVEKVLRYFGFYNARIESGVRDQSVEFNIETGEPVRIGRIDLEAQTPEGLARLREQFTPDEGEPFRHRDYEQAKTRVMQSFLRDGYLKARFEETRVKILPGNRTAEIRLELDEGIRYRFGPVKIEGMSDYPEDFQGQWKSFESGEYFSQTKLLQFYRGVQGSGLFESVSIDASPDQAIGDQVPVNLKVEPWPPYSLTAALGYATDFGPRIRLNLKRYNVFGMGHVLSADIVVDTRQQFLKGNYAIPVSDRPNRAYTLFSTVQNRFLPDDEQRLINFGFEYNANFGKFGQYSAGAAYNFEQFTDQNQDRTIGKYFNVESHRTWLYLDDNIDPSSGFSLDISGKGVAEPLLSDFSALRIEGNGAAYEAFLDKLIRLRSRLQLGYLFASKEPIELPNSLRFFAGGVRSVRGYRYQNLAPKNPRTGEIVGGKAILTSSVEAELRVYENFGWVAYSDFGGATDDLSIRDFGFSLGTGVRWHSPVGPMDLSVAFPLRNSSETFRLVVTLGRF